MLRIAAGLHNVDREAVLAQGGEDVDAAGFHSWPGLVGMAAALVEGAFVAQAARTLAETERLVVAGEKQLALQRRLDSFRDWYNDRVHQGIGGRTPGSAWSGRPGGSSAAMQGP